MAASNPPRLQIAQILADLSDLQAADPSAALALVTANHGAPTSTSTSTLASASASTTSIPKPRPSNLNPNPNPILTRHPSGKQPSRATLSPSSSSASSSVSFPSISQYNPRRLDDGNNLDPDPDLERAATLLSLWESRARLRAQQQQQQQGVENAALLRARRMVEGVAERYAWNGGEGGLGR